MILVAGGTGLLGTLVTSSLVAEGATVRTFSRGTPRHDVRRPTGVTHVSGDVRDPDACISAATACTCIVSAVHGVNERARDAIRRVDRVGTTNLVSAARATGARLVLLSVAGAGPDAPSELFRSKWEAEEIVRRSGVPWTIVRATAFAQTWAEVLALTAGASGRPVIIGRGDRPVRFVDVRDVASVVARSAVDPTLEQQVIDVCGPSPMTLTELAELLRPACAWTGPPRHLPVPAARLLAVLLGTVRPDRARHLRLGLQLGALPTPCSTPDWARTRPLDASLLVPPVAP